MAGDLAWTLAALSTLDGHLPTGSPLSPIMSYFAHEDVWLSVMRLARDAGCTLTLYMDDVTISGESVPGELIWQIKQEVRSAGLRLNDKKQRRFSAGEGVVTGVVVTPAGVRPPKGSHLKLKRLRHDFREATTSEAKEQIGRRLRGLEAQHRQVTKTGKR